MPTHQNRSNSHGDFTENFLGKQEGGQPEQGKDLRPLISSLFFPIVHTHDRVFVPIT